MPRQPENILKSFEGSLGVRDGYEQKVSCKQAKAPIYLSCQGRQWILVAVIVRVSWRVNTVTSWTCLYGILVLVKHCSKYYCLSRVE